MVEAFGYEIRCRIVFLFLVATLATELVLFPTVVVAANGPQRRTTTTTTTPTQDRNTTKAIHQRPDAPPTNDDHDSGMLPSDDGHLPFSRPLDESDTFYDCTCTKHKHQRDPPIQISSSKQGSGGGARIFYLILVHNERTIRDGILLFRAIRDKRNTVVFHLDRKILEELEKAKNSTTTIRNATSLQEAYSQLHQETTACPCGSTVVIESVHRVEWSKWSMNLPTLWGMELAVSDSHWGHWDVFINLSGDTMPVYTPETTARVFDRLNGINFITSRSCETGFIPTNVYLFPPSWHKRVHYTHNEQDGRPIIEWVDPDGTARREVVIAHFGSQWVALQPDFCSYFVSEIKRPDSLPRRYQQYLKRTGKVMTDETFLPTVLMHVATFNQTLPQVDDDGYLIYNNPQSYNDEEVPLPRMQYLRYERMDEHYPSAIDGYYPAHPRYDVPSTADPTLVPPRVWGPYFLGIYDLANVRASGALFMRKVSAALDANLYNLLPVDTQDEIANIQWPARGVAVSPLPNWQEEKLHLMKIAAKRAKQKGEDIPEHIQAQMKVWEQQDQEEEALKKQQEDNQMEDIFPDWASEDSGEVDDHQDSLDGATTLRGYSGNHREPAEDGNRQAAEKNGEEEEGNSVIGDSL